MLNPRAVALQGIGFAPLYVGLQGFVTVELTAGRRPRRHGIKAEFYKADQTLDLLRQEDELATDLIVALLTKGFFDGT